jgi:acyl-coenzyme A thioesterase PaaI-like protein
MSASRLATCPDDLPDAARIAGLSGFDFMRAMLAADLPHPPIARIMGYRLDQVERGCVAFRATPGCDHLNPTGGTDGGWHGTLIGSAIEALGQVDHAGRSTAVAQGRIAGVADGRLYATDATTCLNMDARV